MLLDHIVEASSHTVALAYEKRIEKLESKKIVLVENEPMAVWRRVVSNRTSKSRWPSSQVLTESGKMASYNTNKWSCG